VTAKARSMALGIVFSGFFVSSDIRLMMLKPTKAKKIIADPLRVP